MQILDFAIWLNVKDDNFQVEKWGLIWLDTPIHSIMYGKIFRWNCHQKVFLENSCIGHSVFTTTLMHHLICFYIPFGYSPMSVGSANETQYLEWAYYQLLLHLPECPLLLALFPRSGRSVLVAELLLEHFHATKWFRLRSDRSVDGVQTLLSSQQSRV